MVKSVTTALARRAGDTMLSRPSRRARAEHLTYLAPRKLRTLERCIEQINRTEVPGDFVEAGIALGGSALVLASLMGPGRTFHGYDVFEMIPPPGDRDDEETHARYQVIASGQSEGISGDPYYGYLPDLYDRVAATFERWELPVGNRVHLHRGLFQDTLNPTDPVALAHIDSDWYEPVKTCLERIAPVLSPGGFLILDDYNDYGGCRQALDEFLAARTDFELVAGRTNAVVRRRPEARSSPGQR